VLTLALADLPFLNHLTRKVRGPSYGLLPEGQSLRAIYHDPIQQQSSEAEVNQVQRLLTEMTPPPLTDLMELDYDGDSGQLPSNKDADAASDLFPPPSPLAHTSGDLLPPPSPLTHTDLSGKEISEPPSAPAGETAQGQIPAEGEIGAEGTEKPPHRRGRPAGARNKPKEKPDAAPRAKRQVRKRARETPSSSSDSDSFDQTTPIVVRVRQEDPPPPKKTTRTRATAAKTRTIAVKTSTPEERREYIQRRSETSVIIRNFSTDLQSFLNYLNNEGAVSDIFGSSLKYDFSKHSLLQSAAEHERYEQWLGRLKDALEHTDINQSTLIKNNASSVLSTLLMRRSYWTYPETDFHDGLRKGQEPQTKRFPDQSIHKGTCKIFSDRISTENL